MFYECIIAFYVLLILQGGTQPIHFAAHFGKTEIIEVLVDSYGIDPSTQSEVRCIESIFKIW